MVRSDEDRARDLYAERDADDAWRAKWSDADPTARFTRERRDARLALAASRARERLGDPASWRVLEIGVGGGGLLPWTRDVAGVPEASLAGIDLSETRIESARRVLPAADLRTGSAADMPWPDASFDVVIASTLFSSVLDPDLRSSIAAEATRVLKPGGAILWYDMRSDFFAAGLLRGLARPTEDWFSRSEIAALFPGATLELGPATLFLPFARMLLKLSPQLAERAEDALPGLRGHYLGLILPKAASR